MTNDLPRRLTEHRQGLIPGFTKKYHVKYLAYYEEGQDINQVIFREKLIKSGSRKDKEALIHAFNPEWRGLFREI